MWRGKIKLAVVVWLLWLPGHGVLAASSSFDLILNRYRAMLLEPPATNDQEIRRWIATLTPDGRWPDIDYTSQNPGQWQPSMHLMRVRLISQSLVNPRSGLWDEPQAIQAVNHALDHWITRRYHCVNWWFNDIGIPQQARDIIVLLGPRLSGKRYQGVLAILNQFGRPMPGGGANTAWEAGLGVIYGALTHDRQMVTHCATLLQGAIQITNHEGIQADFSFHQHGARLQQFHYGAAFLAENARLAWLLRGTAWAFPEDKGRLLADFVVNGDQWMCRGLYTVPATLDRAVGRPGSLRVSDWGDSLRYLIQTFPAEAPALQPILNRQEGKGAPLVGYRAFPRSDFMTYHRPKFSFFVKMISDRTLPPEAGGNGDDLQGWFLNDGDHYALRDGAEYFNLMPVWDWELAPGVTRAADAGRMIQREAFAGAAGGEFSGAASMKLHFDNAAGHSLSARKFWAAEGDRVVCLTGDLQTRHVHQPVRTAMDQCRLRGPVTVGEPGGSARQLAGGNYDALPVKWVFHDGLAYIPLAGEPVSLRLGPATGSWREVDCNASADLVAWPVFMPVLEEGEAPQGRSGGFVLAACATPGQAADIAAHPDWQILRNDANCQAVLFEDQTLMAAFFVPAQLNGGGRFHLSPSQPCLVWVHGTEVQVCDPTHAGGSLCLICNGKPYRALLPADGTSVSLSLSNGQIITSAKSGSAHSLQK